MDDMPDLFASTLALWLPLTFGVLLVAVAGIIAYKRKTGGQTCYPNTEGSSVKFHLEMETTGDVPPNEIIPAISDDNLRGLLESRMEDMEDEDDGVPKALAMVAFLDEIQILSPKYRSGDAAALQKLAAAMHRQLVDMDAEVIDDDKWDAARQRAQCITRDLPAGAEPVITEKVASGLLFQGAVRRKQIVNLRMAA